MLCDVTDAFSFLLGMFALSLLWGILICLTEDLGDLDRVKRIVKLVGFVNCTDGFMGQPKVVNGASDLFAEVRRLIASRHIASHGTSSVSYTHLTLPTIYSV